MALRPENIYVQFSTELGSFVIEVYEERAPHTTAQFLRFVDEGRYTRSEFFRSVSHDNDHGDPPIKVVQLRVPESLDDGSIVIHENTEMTGITHSIGTVSLGRGEIGTGTAAALFVCLEELPCLDFGGTRKRDGYGFAAFGRVIRGLDAIRRISDCETLKEASRPFHCGQLIKHPPRIHAAVRVCA